MKVDPKKVRSVVTGIIMAVIISLVVNWIMNKILGFGKFKRIVPNQQFRGCDPQGCGYYGATRAGHVHQGVDVMAKPGETVSSPIDGKVVRFPHPYADDLSYQGIEITNTTHKVKMFYVASFLPAGTIVRAGQPVGTAQNISAKYGGGMTNHVHVEVYNALGSHIDPTPLLS